MNTAEITIGNEYNRGTFDTQEQAKKWIDGLLIFEEYPAGENHITNIEWDGNSFTAIMEIFGTENKVFGQIAEGDLPEVNIVEHRVSQLGMDFTVMFDKKGVRIVVKDGIARIDYSAGEADRDEKQQLLKIAYQIFEVRDEQ